MLRDLSEVGAAKTAIEADAVVIGAGIAGILLSSRLRKHGMRVVMFESGSRSQSGDSHPLNDVILDGHNYRGAQSGRARCLGGTSTRWGGAMLPMTSYDLGQHTAGWDVEWPITIDEVAPYFDAVERIFDLPLGGFELSDLETPELLSAGFQCFSAKWAKFSRRNLANVFSKDINGSSLDVWINATVTRLIVDEAGRLSEVEAKSLSGPSIRVKAPWFAITAGAIESTRLLLKMNRDYNDRIFDPEGPLGRYFHDHISAQAGEIHATNPRRLNEALGMRFSGRSMRDVRIQPSEHFRRARCLPGAFAHLAAISNGSDGMTALRAVMKSLQCNSLPRRQDALSLVKESRWFLSAVWWFLIKRRLLAPSDAQRYLYLVMEQEPHSDNRIGLSNDRRDDFGLLFASLSWKVRDADLENFKALQEALKICWDRSWLSELGVFELNSMNKVSECLRNGGDIFHPGGTTRMGRNCLSGVVNTELQTFNIPNLYVVSTSAFPSGGSANPTFLLMALALRAAEHMARSWKASNPH